MNSIAGTPSWVHVTHRLNGVAAASVVRLHMSSDVVLREFLFQPLPVPPRSIHPELRCVLTHHVVRKPPLSRAIPTMDTPAKPKRSPASALALWHPNESPHVSRHIWLQRTSMAAICDADCSNRALRCGANLRDDDLELRDRLRRRVDGGLALP